MKCGANVGAQNNVRGEWNDDDDDRDDGNDDDYDVKMLVMIMKDGDGGCGSYLCIISLYVNC